MFPSAGRVLRRHLPHDRSIGCAGHRLDVGLTPWPSATCQLSSLGIATERNSAPPVSKKSGLQAADFRSEIRPVVRLHANFLAAVLQPADFTAECTDLFDVLHRCAAATIRESFHRKL